MRKILNLMAVTLRRGSLCIDALRSFNAGADESRSHAGSVGTIKTPPRFEIECRKRSRGDLIPAYSDMAWDKAWSIAACKSAGGMPFCCSQWVNAANSGLSSSSSSLGTTSSFPAAFALW